MSSGDMNRRRALTAAAGWGVAAFASTARAQQASPVPRTPNPLLDARDVGKLHQETMDSLLRFLKGTPLDTKGGCLKVIDFLVEYKVITYKEAQALRELVKAVFESPTIDALRKTVDEIYGGLDRKGAEVATAIASIAHDSVEFAEKMIRSTDFKMVILFVSADVVSALAGAATGAKLGQWAAIVGALAGAVSGSLGAYFKVKPPGTP